MIEFLCEVEEDTKNYITALLPRRKTKVVEVYESKLKNLVVRIYTDLKEPEQAAAWVKQFQSVTKAFYSIRNSVSTTGRFVNYKQVLNCQHNTRVKSKSATEHSRTKNTDCPARITVTLHAIKKRYQGRNLALYNLRKEMRCEISLVLTHNHDLESVDALKYRRIPSEINEKLLKLYQSGHSPKSALETLKRNICLHSDDPQTALADRSQCPDYMYCYHLYTKYFKSMRKKVLDDAATSKELLQKRLEEYNAETDGNSIQMIMHELDYVICICTPLMKRVHKYIKSSSEIAFVDSSVHQSKCRVFVILTHSDCGGLPLAVIVTSSNKCEVLSLGFQMVESMVGEDMFGGHPEGPKAFFTGDSQAEHSAVKDTWKGCECYISITHLLQSVWTWLNKPKNNIPIEKRSEYFNSFKSILYSTSVDEASQKFYALKSDVCNHTNFVVYLDLYWQIKEQWILAYRINNLKWDYTNNISEAIMRVIKAKLFHQVKSFNLVQVVDYILTNFGDYYEMRLLESSKNQLQKNVFGKLTKLPSTDLLGKMKVVNTNTVLVPCETVDDLYYTVHVDALRCTCSQRIVRKLCNHIDWACMVLHSETFNTNIDNALTRKMLHRIATGKEPPSDWLLPLWGDDPCFTPPDSSPDCESDNCVVEIDPQLNCGPESQENTNKVWLEKGRKAIRELSNILDKHLQMNLTNSFVEALQKMCEDAKAVSSGAELESLCSTFGKVVQQKKNNIKCPDQSTKKRKLNPSSQKTQVEPHHVLQIPISAQMITTELDPNDNTKPRIAPKISCVLVQSAPMVILAEEP